MARCEHLKKTRLRYTQGSSQLELQSSSRTAALAWSMHAWQLFSSLRRHVLGAKANTWMRGVRWEAATAREWTRKYAM